LSLNGETSGSRLLKWDSGEGFYVVRYADGVATHDYLQSDILMAHRCAQQEWAISPSAWREALPGELPLWEQQSSH
jgi:hypothetical protein